MYLRSILCVFFVAFFALTLAKITKRQTGGAASIDCSDSRLRLRMVSARIPFRCNRAASPSARQVRASCGRPLRGKCDAVGCCYQAELLRCFKCNKGISNNIDDDDK
ncbi:hypothetical protein Anas_01668 [Armadillidium nasatum]|uniref:P-type domain-containing protein n=1 Tax=Armadillidium nasatum TaxID=96803 RepID=A0A5N5TBU5_9CRUS|nr:hypothetical protein Anas_01668 [Armadillidium nasatum]